jgi:hypothetical protein
MENTKLSLADFKAKAEKVETIDILEKVHGGANDDCHVEPKIKDAGLWYLFLTSI